MIFLLIAFVLWLLAKGQTVLAGGSPVIQNATGSSLGATLGTSPAPPSYYGTGNPGYTATSPATQTPIIAAPSFLPQVSAGIQSNVNQTPTQQLTQAAPANPSAPPVVQPVAIRTRLVPPEVASAFWTRMPYPITRTPARM